MSANPETAIPAPVSCPVRKRSRFLNLLQIGGILLIVAVHTGVRGTQIAQVPLELFFVMAGLNMARYVDRHETLGSFARSRVRRLAPEISVVWCIALIVFLVGLRTAGVAVYLITIPLFLQNFAEPYLRPVPGVNWVFLDALWFAAALLQLQVIVFLARRTFTRCRPLLLLPATAGLGVAFAALVAAFHGGVTRNLNYAASDSVYRMALTHVSPFVFGFILGRGLLPRLGSWFPLLAGLMATLGALNFLLAGSRIPLSSYGFPVEMAFNFQYLWGYPLVALVLTSFCAPDGLIASAVERLELSRAVDLLVDRLARLTYGVYVFHCLFLSALEYELWSHGLVNQGSVQILLFVVVSCAAFVSAWLFQHAWRWLRCRVCDAYPLLVLSTPGQLPPRCMACRHFA